MRSRWLVAVVVVLAVAAVSEAKTPPVQRKTVPAAAPAPASPTSGFHPEAPYTAALLLDRDSGQVLFAKNEHLRWPPASMTKMMTVLLALEQVRAHALRLDDPIIASAWASKIGGSQVYLAEGEQFTLGDLLGSIMIASANDASVAVSERIAGSTDAFVAMMNERAKELGMADTEFHSVHGLPPGKGQLPDLMSAADLAILGRALAAYPEAMEWAKTSEAPFRGGALQMRNTNHLVRTYPGADGLKTGFYDAAGFEVTATATRDDLRLMAVVLGVPTKKGCFDEAAKLLTSGFNGWKAIVAAKSGATVGGPITVTRGKIPQVTGVASGDLRLVLPRSEAQGAKVEVKVPAEIAAPVKKGQVVGEVVVTRAGRQLGRVDVVASSDVESTSWLSGWY
ncbi:MAG: D-alanyl-D-alanine carboxypeptidase [Deltaproteobacteria bacterium]|nr:D-alanyl-D-alanine carboxypeptidase [Deltaproteobacteria bacterium]